MEITIKLESLADTSYQVVIGYDALCTVIDTIGRVIDTEKQAVKIHTSGNDVDFKIVDKPEYIDKLKEAQRDWLDDMKYGIKDTIFEDDEKSYLAMVEFLEGQKQFCDGK